jgi:hypothetical protein
MAKAKLIAATKRWFGCDQANCELFTRALAPAPGASKQLAIRLCAAKLLPKRLSNMKYEGIR